MKSTADLYSASYREFGPTARGVGWQDEDVQWRRFHVLMEGNQYGISSILDVGCGYGALVDFLVRHKSSWFNHIKYMGIDVTPELLDVAKARHEWRPDNPTFKNSRAFHRFDVRNMVAMETPMGYPETFDLVVCSGALSFYEMPDKLDMLDAMWAISDKVLAFNMKSQETYLGDLSMILPRFGTGNWKVYHDYGLDDMTVVVKR